MLTLERPAVDLAGLTVYADHADDSVHYYAAPNPVLVRTGGQPMLDIFTYAVELKSSPLSGTHIPDQLGAGFLTMGVEATLSPAQHAAALQALATLLDRDPARLSLGPIPYIRGSVSVIALDAASGAAAASAPPVAVGGPRFVQSVIGAGTPSLVGGLRSIFSLSLSQEGVTFLEGLYADGAAPVGVVYDLTFLGLRPSVQAHVHADVSRIYTELGGKASVGCAYVRAEVDGVLTTLEQTGGVTVELTSQAVGPEAQAAKELALSLFKDKIIQELFDPAPRLPAMQVPALPGAESTSLVTLSLKAKKDEELRTVDYDFSERSPEERTHAPQAFVPTLLTREELAARVHHVDLASDFFQLLEVLVSGPSEEELAALGLRSVTVDLVYGAEEATAGGPPAETGSLVFRPGSAPDLTWAVRRRGRRTLGYTAAVTYEFARENGVDADALTYRLPARPQTGRTLSIRPYDDVAVLDVEVDLGRLDPGVRDVDVDLSFVDPTTGFDASHHLRLSPAVETPRAERTWQVRTATAGRREYTAQSTLTFTDGAVYAIPPQTCDEPLLRVDAPFRGTRSLLIQPNVTSDDVTSMTVEVRYADVAAGYHRQFTQVLTPAPVTDPPTARWSPITLAWPIIDPGHQEIHYRVTTAAGGVVDAGEWTPTTDPSLLVGDVGHRSRRVEVRLIGPSLAEVGIDAIQVRVGAAGSADTDAQSAFFDPATPGPIALTVPAGPGAPAGFRYQVITFRADGTQHVDAWVDTDQPLVIVSTRSG